MRCLGDTSLEHGPSILKRYRQAGKKETAAEEDGTLFQQERLKRLVMNPDRACFIKIYYVTFLGLGY